MPSEIVKHPEMMEQAKHSVASQFAMRNIGTDHKPALKVMKLSVCVYDFGSTPEFAKTQFGAAYDYADEVIRAFIEECIKRQIIAAQYRPYAYLQCDVAS